LFGDKIQRRVLPKAPFWEGNSPPNFGTPPRSFGQVYSIIKNPVIAVTVNQRAAVIQVYAYRPMLYLFPQYLPGNT